MPPFIDPCDSVEAKLTNSARSNLARVALSTITFQLYGFAAGRSGYLDTNPVKIMPVVDLTANAVASILIVNNSFDVGDKVTIYGVDFEVGVDWVAGLTIDDSALNLTNSINTKLNSSANQIIISATSVGATINLMSLVPGALGNTFTLSKTDHTTLNFNLSGGVFTGGADGALVDKIYPNALPVISSNPTALKQFRITSGLHDGPVGTILSDSTQSWTINYYAGQLIQNLTDGSRGLILSNTANTITAVLCKGIINKWTSGDSYLVGVEMPLLSSVSTVCRLGQTEGTWGYGELATYAQIKTSNIPSEVGSLFMYSVAHFPLTCKTDKQILIFRVITTL